MLARYRIACPTITGAGTGSFEFEAASGLYPDLQCGSYIFMNADYRHNRGRDGGPFATFEPSLFVWATVMSRPAEDRAIVDAGLKALAFVRGRRWSATSPPRATSARRTSTAGLRSQPPPTGSGSATRSGLSPATATNRQNLTTDMSVCVATASSRSGRLPPAARSIEPGNVDVS